jgi:hypothetical protein
LRSMKTECTEVQQELAWLLAEEGPVGSTPKISGHLEGCPRCAREARRLKALLGSLGCVAVPEPPEVYWQSFLPRLRVKLAAERTNGHVRMAWVWALAGTAASFLLAGLAVGRWEIPPETRARLRLEQVAEGIDPDSLQQALDTLLPDADLGVPPGGRNEATAEAADMARALEEVLPEHDSGFSGATSEWTPAQGRRLEQPPDPGWV